MIGRGARGEEACRGVEKKSVGTTVNETVRKGCAVENRGEFTNNIGRIGCRVGRRIVGPGADSEDELTGYRLHSPQWNTRQLYDHAVVVLAEKGNRVLHLTGERNGGPDAAGSAAGKIYPIVGSAGASLTAVIGEETDSQNPVKTR